jgi:4-hydroxy-4-methyl-2-oxoglutarate aldolase
VSDAVGVAERLAALGASGVADATGGTGVVSAGLVRYSGSGAVAGRAVTADCTEGSLLAVFPALDQAQAGDALCMTAPGDTAYLGDLLATDIANRGLAAAVVDGLIRDSDVLPSLPVSVFARGVTPRARRGDEPGRSMVPISIGGVQIRPRDWIVADGDGVVVIASDDVDAVLEKAEENARLEERILERVKAGVNVMDAVRAVVGSAQREEVT